MPFSIDDFLGGKVKLKQYDNGYKATSDAVLLAAFVPAKAGETVLDVGIGTGAVSLCLMARVPNLQVTGLDIQKEMLCQAEENAQINCQNLHLILGSVQNPPKELVEKTFHHVVTNPPYFSETRERSEETCAIAHKQEVPLSVWLDFCLKRVKPKGTLTLIHRIESLPEILKTLDGRLGSLVAVPIWPKAGKKPKRIIVQGTLNSKTPFALHTGFVMYNDDDTQTPKMKEVMREGKALF